MTNCDSHLDPSTLSDQDAVNKFKQWRIASWVQEANRHLQEGSAVAHHEDVVSNKSGGSKDKPMTPVSSSTADSKQQHRKRIAADNNNNTLEKTATKLLDANHFKPIVSEASSKRLRHEAQVPTSATNNNNNTSNDNTATLNSLLSSLFSSSVSTATNTTPVPVTSTANSDLEAILRVLAPQPQQTSQNSALLQFQQQMQNAALLQLQYSALFGNPLTSLYNPLSSMTTSQPTPTQTTASTSNNDAALTEALLSLLGSNALMSNSNSNSLANSPAQLLLQSLVNAQPPTSHTATTVSNSKKQSTDCEKLVTGSKTMDKKSIDQSTPVLPLCKDKNNTNKNKEQQSSGINGSVEDLSRSASLDKKALSDADVSVNCKDGGTKIETAACSLAVTVPDEVSSNIQESSSHSSARIENVAASALNGNTAEIINLQT